VNAVGPESLVTAIVCEYGAVARLATPKLRLTGFVEITGTTISVTVNVTGSVVELNPFCEIRIDP
jgi:hypothetical protein